MRLESVTGSLVKLDLIGYQFPDTTSRDGWDENWLLVSGRVQERGESWEFSDPCLTVGEAVELLKWLREVRSRIDKQRAVRPQLPPLTFTEPLLEFHLKSVDAASAAIEVHLRHEALPYEARRNDAEERIILLIVSGDSVQQAIASWAQEIERFTAR